MASAEAGLYRDACLYDLLASPGMVQDRRFVADQRLVSSMEQVLRGYPVYLSDRGLLCGMQTQQTKAAH